MIYSKWWKKSTAPIFSSSSTLVSQIWFPLAPKISKDGVVLWTNPSFKTLHKPTDDFMEGCRLVKTQGLIKHAQLWFFRASVFCQTVTALKSIPLRWRDLLWRLIWTNADSVNDWWLSAGASARSNQSCTPDVLKTGGRRMSRVLSCNSTSLINSLWEIIIIHSYTFKYNLWECVLWEWGFLINLCLKSSHHDFTCIQFENLEEIMIMKRKICTALS